MQKCPVGVVKITGSSLHVLSPALAPGKACEPESYIYQRAMYLFPCMMYGFFSLLGFIPGGMQPCSCSWLGVMPDGARLPESQVPLVLILL